MALPHGASLLRHLIALRQTLSRSLLGWLAGTLICYPFWEEFWKLLLRPLHDLPAASLPRIVAATPVAAVSTSIHVAMLGGALLASPWIAWQLWHFLAPALRPRERHFLRAGTIFFLAAFLTGTAFGYFVLLPLILRWLVGFGRDLFIPLWSLDAYASLCLRLLLAVGMLFEWPLLTWMLSRTGMVRATTFARHWRAAIVASFVLACFFVPPDPVSQSILALPMVLLYFLGVLTARLGERTRTAKEGR